MITKLLVANRGEIARRIFRTCRSMGIGTVAAHAESDRSAPFVTEADEAYGLGAGPASETYLRADRLIEAAAITGADAVHPGYGFLSEDASFARAVVEAGLAWVGPSPAAIEAMGSKLEAKRLMTAAGVDVLPSIDLTGLAPEEVDEAAARCGFPLLVKASAGGGGKGMQVVTLPGEVAAAVEAGRRQAEAAFGDGTVFLEPYLSRPRHIEVQVFGDSQGTVVPIFERECSIQRRHQKIVEECPSPAVDAGLRAALGEAAVTAAQAVGYQGAGTVEFLVQDGRFWFLEMNTRLQVEHPVTEAITGLDLVRLQILVADGEPLPPAVLNAAISGHAIEVRLYAEDPLDGFLPTGGRLERFRFPPLPGVRVDSGVEDGSVVTADYDPLLAKVVAWAPTRNEAASLLARAVETAEIHGITTNRHLLASILRDPDFLAGDLDTTYLDRHDPAVLGRSPVPERDVARAALAAALAAQAARLANRTVLARIPSGWRNNPAGLQVSEFDVDGGDTVRVGYRFVPRQEELEVEIDGRRQAGTRIDRCTPQEVVLVVGAHRQRFRVHRVGDIHHVDGPSGYLWLAEHPRFPDAATEEESGSLHAPMPGRIIDVVVAEGDVVEAGAALVVMEAMKMEHTLRAPAGGIVASVKAKVGDQVEGQAVLVVIEEMSDDERERARTSEQPERES